ncbi:nuclear polyadenylated RNA-binding protein Nab2 [Xylona heveae TC161]|uniref:Nuclear polyadenylated RNA-binding protein Nab2 n=1 Tax=Xylona heveae (strain CBS 132557 / TC161) TaxID=1328760 RepID=A0A165GN36_XYLHT|nr:nuclear polyadenylated RNA-binding protein Nab2 [Xylona heveae TC161]KZF22391.1 nuclear polyadenylated RNA-binding protein Nab2 [Xylona heveae TC161]
MAVEFALNTPLADALNNVLQPKLVEVGWTTGDIDDSALSEYILLMLVNGKTQDQIAVELSNDLLGLDPGDTRGAEFSGWLFEQLRILNGQINGQTAQQTGVADENSGVSAGNFDGIGNDPEGQGQDAVMGEAGEGMAEGGIPTGPKSMRNGPRGNNRRLMGQLNKAMDRNTDPLLHRVRAQQGTGRINSHGRDAPKGPRNQRMGGRGAGPMLNTGMPPGGPANALMGMSPQQQMQLFAMYEEQARMMSQILSPQQQQQMFMGPAMGGPMVNPSGPGAFGGQHQQQGKSLFERVDNNPRRNGGFNKRQPNNSRPDQGQQESRDTNPASSMDVESPQAAPDPATTVCKFNLSCTKEDCSFAHQSTAAPPGVTIDVNDTCSFGVACKNKKCVARHPSPAQKTTHQAAQDCRFYPNCTNPVCPFRHPSMPLCRNGADCTTPDCKFTHLQTMCRFNPCLNPVCPYKHEDGQKRGKFEDKVWTAPGAKENEHVSERKFVDDNTEEELIVPGGGVPEEQKAVESGV